ncbi:hypothetical protein L2E82_20782 [Cichorium intybus]|uniref:Uncharacterized protein n=1 Tax=Cichorium intybus TaxID=13427 RepID=A0ACB9DUL8_CICIN|nr:hypothetical protein L2E82_20782 [Cichorium intybus]
MAADLSKVKIKQVPFFPSTEGTNQLGSHQQPGILGNGHAYYTYANNNIGHPLYSTPAPGFLPQSGLHLSPNLPGNSPSLQPHFAQSFAAQHAQPGAPVYNMSGLQPACFNNSLFKSNDL